MFDLINNSIFEVVGNTYMFQGLPIEAIAYIKNSGLWIQLTNEIKESVDQGLLDTTCQVYFSRPNNDLGEDVVNILTLIIENNEAMIGTIHNLIDCDKSISVNNILHQYVLIDDLVVREEVQLVDKGIVFLKLTDELGNTIYEWEDSEIDKILNN